MVFARTVVKHPGHPGRNHAYSVYYALPGDLERARDQLDDLIVAALAEARETGS